MRLLGGYAWRTATPLDAVVFELPGVSAAPRDLGSLDLSGAQLAFHLGLAL
jgi:hypothetical protein